MSHTINQSKLIHFLLIDLVTSMLGFTIANLTAYWDLQFLRIACSKKPCTYLISQPRKTLATFIPLQGSELCFATYYFAFISS